MSLLRYVITVNVSNFVKKIGHYKEGTCYILVVKWLNTWRREVIEENIWVNGKGENEKILEKIQRRRG